MRSIEPGDVILFLAVRPDCQTEYVLATVIGLSEGSYYVACSGSPNRNALVAPEDILCVYRRDRDAEGELPETILTIKEEVW